MTSEMWGLTSSNLAGCQEAAGSLYDVVMIRVGSEYDMAAGCQLAFSIWGDGEIILFSAHVTVSL